MSEEPTPSGQAGPTAGALLRQAREAAGLHVAALAVSLKVPVRKLEALEQDRYEQLTDTVFVRALASSVCRTLNVDPQPVLERLPRTIMPRLVPDTEGINTAFRAPGDGAPPSWRQQLSRPVFLVVFALLLGALVLVLLPGVRRLDSNLSSTPTTKSAEPGAAAGAAAVTQSPPGEAVTTVVSPAMAAAALEAPAAGASGAAAAAAVPGPASLLTGGAPALAPAAATTAAAAPAATEIVVFRSNGPSWIEVTDAKGVVAVRKVLAAGEATGASGTLPLQVTVGRADVTQVQVRGKPFDLKPVSRDNVARFEVK